MNEIPFGPGAMAVVGVYIASLLAIGFFAYRARSENSLGDFYLAGRGLGFFVLLLTMFATQYSGNTLLGFTGRTYRDGFSWITCVHFMTAIVVVYLLFAPQLYRLARRRGFITPVDFLRDRYQTPALDLAASTVMILALANYALAQLMAMGKLMRGLAGRADPQAAENAYFWGVILLATIIVIYENLGGMRAVAWTDALQGLILIVGFGLLVWIMFHEFGGLAEATDRVFALAPEKATPPDAEGIRTWFSYIVVVGIGGALYPQAIQRIYAARSERALRRSLSLMALMPLATTLVAVIVGVMGIAYLAPIAEGRTDDVLPLLCRKIAIESTLGYWLVVTLFGGVLAAVMSTADSALLSISSMLVKDVYGRWIRPNATEGELTRAGKLSSWALIAVLAALAIALRKTTLVTLLDRKFDLLVQLGPAFILGVHARWLRGGAVFAGLLAGLIVALGLVVSGNGMPWGVHPGLYGLAVNLAIAVAGSWFAGEKMAENRAISGA
jgi:SSS family solute:Na+ symporter/sodium/pantothenate symporter